MNAITEKQEAVRLAERLSLPLAGVQAAIHLLDEGNTVPFIARYRKDETGGIDDQDLRKLANELLDLRELEEKRETTIRLIDELGLLTDDVRKSLLAASTKTAIDDIYRPFRPKRRTRAGIAREQGLEPLAKLLTAKQNTTAELEALASSLVNPEQKVSDSAAAFQGAMDIIAEELSDNAGLRDRLRRQLHRDGLFSVGLKKQKKLDDNEQASYEQKLATYRSYAEFETPVNRLRGHQVLAINRGEKEGILQPAIQTDEAVAIDQIRRQLPRATAASAYLDLVSADSWKRLIEPSLHTELRGELTARAEAEAIEIFGRNLKATLLASPLREKRVLALDPGYRNGCKLAVTAEDGQVLDTAVIYPVKPRENIDGSSRTLDRLIERHKVDVLALGNGTATRETEDFLRRYQEERGSKLPVVIVNEAGASVYSASPIAAEEFPDLDVSVRGAISLARRLQDPLAELVKVEPAAIGVGQYQHDMDQKLLTKRLGEVVEDAVNLVGVDLNTASVPLLSYVSGVNSTIAKNIHDTRLRNGPFKKRSDLLKVPRLGPRAYEQCAGFLRIRGGQEALDNTSVHPESYKVAKQLLDVLEIRQIREGSRIEEKTEELGVDRLAEQLGTGPKTLADIAKALDKPGRDSRADLEIVERSSEIKSIEDLLPDMVLPGVVRNVLAFGAFVDLGVHEDGLVHISQLADRFIDDPSTVVSPGDRVMVRVLEVDIKRKRISLSMKGVKQ